MKADSFAVQKEHDKKELPDETDGDHSQTFDAWVLGIRSQCGGNDPAKQRHRQRGSGPNRGDLREAILVNKKSSCRACTGVKRFSG